ncbi:MAG: hypothetical protein AAF928_19325 [Myxococcota bacterium]
MARLSVEAEELWRRAEALAARNPGSPAARALLHRLLRAVEGGGEDGRAAGEAYVFVHRKLGEALARDDPWAASLHLKRVLAHRPDDDGAWGHLGLCQSLLGHHRFAVRSYERARALAPHNPWYAHNLGHLYDVVFDDGARALPLLRAALAALPVTVVSSRATPACNEATAHRLRAMIASYAHALMRHGSIIEARAQMLEVVQSGQATPAQHELYDHIVAAYDRAIAPFLPPRGRVGDGRRAVRERRRTGTRGTP